MKMSCKEATRAISDGLDRKLGMAERLKLRAHLFICHYCTDFFTQTRFLRKAARQAAERERAPKQ